MVRHGMHHLSSPERYRAYQESVEHERAEAAKPDELTAALIDALGHRYDPGANARAENTPTSGRPTALNDDNALMSSIAAVLAADGGTVRMNGQDY